MDRLCFTAVIFALNDESLFTTSKSNVKRLCQTGCYLCRTAGYTLQGEKVGRGPNGAQDVVRELFAGVDLPKLVQRMLVVMHEVCS